jgi:hypothetical protein
MEDGPCDDIDKVCVCDEGSANRYNVTTTDTVLMDVDSALLIRIVGTHVSMLTGCAAIQNSHFEMSSSGHVN